MAKVKFESYVDMTKIKDSMQLDSGTTICRYKTTHALSAVIEVRGEVNVTYKGENYRRPSEFPDELKERIEKNPGFWDVCAPSGEPDGDDGSDIYVGNNNWFEIFVFEGDYCKAYDVIDVEGYTEEQLRECCEEFVQEVA